MPFETAVRIEPWGPSDRALLARLNTPEMTVYVGGPETQAKLDDRQSRYEKPDSRQYRIVVEPGSEPAGWVGYWPIEWRDEQAWEVGWAVVPESQGRGVATAATAQLLEKARDERGYRFAHAFPLLENAPSNALCRRLGFALLGEVDFPGRRGGVVRCNDWRVDLFSRTSTDAGSAETAGFEPARELNTP